MYDAINVLLSGALSGILADTITHPICTVKARLMCQGTAKSLQNSEVVQVYRGFFDAMKTICAKEGPMTLFTGLTAVIVGAAPAQALFFTGMELVKG